MLLKRYFLLPLLFFFISINDVSGQDGNIYIKIDDSSDEHKVWTNLKLMEQNDTTFYITLYQTLTPKSKENKASYALFIKRKGIVIDPDDMLKIKKFYTPEMILDSLITPPYDYEYRYKGRFFVLLKGWGSIWYLHKVAFVHPLWSPSDVD